MSVARGREYVLTHDKAARVRTLIMVSQLGHCLKDLLFRWKTGSLPVDVVGVVSNHGEFGELAASYRIPFRRIPVTPETKAAAESQLLEVIDGIGADLTVLARYMQILSGEVCRQVRAG
jgi:formyltetrahydrofolate deformylase